MMSSMSAKQTHASRTHRQPPTPDVSSSLWRALLFGTLAWLGAAATAGADPPKLTIEGGVRPGNPQFYDWKVTNHHSSPIVYLEFPHYHGDTFHAPEGWAQQWENRSMLGGKDAPGWVRASVDDPGNGISPGGSIEFEMRLARGGALPRPGKVTVRFADGAELIVADVEVPSAHSFLEQNVMLFSLAIIFGIALVIHFRRRRKLMAAGTPAPPTTSSEE